MRDSAGLDALIRAASTPGSPQYGHYLTNAQYMAMYAPTDADVQAATAWLKGEGLNVTGDAPDNLLIHVQAKARDVEQAFGVSINDYSYHGRPFHSNDRNPTVPSNLNISAVSGLSNFVVYKPAITCTPNPGAKCAFDGGDFRSMYDIPGDGKGRTMGFTLWGQELPQSDFDGYAAATGDTKITVGQAGDDGLNWIQIDGSTTESDTDNEVALDTQIAHGVAPGIHETYWLGKDNSSTTLEDVLNAVANSSIKIISNSWGAQNNPCSVDSNEETSLQHGVATGKTFYFSTGDSGASSGCSWPASSQYVVAVGGTTLAFGAGSDSAYTSETALDNGGGCLDAETRPSWQTGIGNAYVWGSSAACTGRATPDVSANSGSGTYLYFDGSPSCCTGGTSLSAPIWAAASEIWNKHNAATGRPGIGFAAPLIYSVANDATTYAHDFHDVTSGTNGFAAVTGWDEATGWGSFDFNKLSNNPVDITYTGPSQANKSDTITLSATLYDQGTTNGLGGRTISFAAAGENCTGTTDGGGNASCTVTIGDDPGTYKAIAVFAGDGAWVAGSDTVDFTVLHIPTKIAYSGATSGDYNDSVTLSAKLTDNSPGTSFSSGDPIPGETLSFSLGAESCSGVTDSSGVVSCTVTPLDTPGSYSVSVSFAGDEPVYEPSSSSTPFTLNQEESALSYTGPLTVHYHDPVTVSATLTDPDGGAGIAGKTVTFTLGIGDTCNGTTDTGGIATCTLTPQQTGTQSLVASFAGDVDYVASGDFKSFLITPEETTMTYTGPTVILASGSTATLTATLVEDGANDTDGDGGSPAPVPAETVTLSLGSQSCTGTTNAAGNVTCTIAVSVPLGPETVGASFAGDTYYQAATASTTAVVFAFPSTGVFTLGDLTANAALPPSTATVTWWSNSWNVLNHLSGGAAPSAFKGFAGVVVLPNTTPATFCSHSWTSSGGNSPPPPVTVPSYMGTIVSKKITKTGNTVSDGYVKIVVVKTNSGYAPGPFNAGTGTIVATFCG